MNNLAKILLPSVIAVSVILPGFANAAEVSQLSKEEIIAQFTDMPDNWTTDSLVRAVQNGLLNGDAGKIMPEDNITRAQMAAIIVRAFGAQNEADLSAFSDISSDKWYYSEFAKAVYMNAFAGTDDGKLNPDNFITYQECFTVVSRVFDLPTADEACLDAFTDGSEVDAWARPIMAEVVGNGYWIGIDNMLKPKDYITRSEFAVLMDNLVKTYINEPGTYTDLPDGNILVRSNDVILDKEVSEDIIIIGDGVTSKIQLLDIDSSNLIVCRGGNVSVTGKINNLRGIVPGVVLDISGGVKRTGRVYVGPGVHIVLGNQLNLSSGN